MDITQISNPSFSVVKNSFLFMATLSKCCSLKVKLSLVVDTPIKKPWWLFSRISNGLRRDNFNLGS